MHDQAVGMLVWFSAVLVFLAVFYGGYYCGLKGWHWVGYIVATVGVVFTLWKMGQ